MRMIFFFCVCLCLLSPPTTGYTRNKDTNQCYCFRFVSLYMKLYSIACIRTRTVTKNSWRFDDNNNKKKKMRFGVTIVGFWWSKRIKSHPIFIIRDLFSTVKKIGIYHNKTLIQYRNIFH